MSFNNFYFLIKKKLRIGFQFGVGRSFGRISVYHRGGRSRKSFIFVDFFRRINSFGFIFKIIKTSLFTSFLGLIIYENGLTNYIILSEKVRVNNLLYSGSYWNVSQKSSFGYAIPLSYTNLFSLVNNVEIYPFKGSSYVRAAGMSAIITAKMSNLKVLLKLKSGWNLIISNYCLSSLGLVSNSLHRFYNYKKAGVIRSLGIRPTVRGVAMNPCDHPHGGGEGKKSSLVGAKSPWGWLTKGTPTKIKKYQIVIKKKFKQVRI